MFVSCKKLKSWTKLKNGQNWKMNNIGQNWKMDKIENWTKLKNGQNWELDKIENGSKLKIGRKWKLKENFKKNFFVQIHEMIFGQKICFSNSLLEDLFKYLPTLCTTQGQSECWLTLLHPFCLLTSFPLYQMMMAFE